MFLRRAASISADPGDATVTLACISSRGFLGGIETFVTPPALEVEVPVGGQAVVANVLRLTESGFFCHGAPCTSAPLAHGGGIEK